MGAVEGDPQDAVGGRAEACQLFGGLRGGVVTRTAAAAVSTHTPRLKLLCDGVLLGDRSQHRFERIERFGCVHAHARLIGVLVTSAHSGCCVPGDLVGDMPWHGCIDERGTRPVPERVRMESTLQR